MEGTECVGNLRDASTNEQHVHRDTVRMIWGSYRECVGV